VSFTDQSSGVTSLLWDFGDGNTSTLQFPTHQYAAPGMYTVCLYTLNSCGRPDSLCQTISVPVGIDDPNLQEFDLYPNPSTGEFIVRVKVTAVSTVNYRLINMLGQTVAEKEVNLVQGTRTERFDLSDQPEGIYLLRMEINGKQHFRKVVKR
jgi:PKD repeat protein